MSILEFLRQFRIWDYAIFDFIVAFGGIYLASAFLTKILRKIRVDIPRQNWLFLTLPIGILIHLLIGTITPLTRDFLNIHNYYILKLAIIILLVLGLRNIRILPKTPAQNQQIN